MTNKFEITCPKCKANFNAEEAFQKHFEIEKDKLQKEFLALVEKSKQLNTPSKKKKNASKN